MSLLSPQRLSWSVRMCNIQDQRLFTVSLICVGVLGYIAHMRRFPLFQEPHPSIEPLVHPVETPVGHVARADAQKPDLPKRDEDGDSRDLCLAQVASLGVAADEGRPELGFLRTQSQMPAEGGKV